MKRKFLGQLAQYVTAMEEAKQRRNIQYIQRFKKKIQLIKLRRILEEDQARKSFIAHPTWESFLRWSDGGDEGAAKIGMANWGMMTLQRDWFKRKLEELKAGNRFYLMISKYLHNNK